MSLIDDVKTLCDRLAPRGWRELLLAVTDNGLDIRQPDAARLREALAAPLSTIDRQRTGFADLHRRARRGVTAGRPEQSLLYHALASAAVHPGGTAAPSADLRDYPTLEELDVLENYIYSLVADRVDPGSLLVAVFAYQYREASRTPHLRHADFAYSRTGIARVGTAAPRYDASRRSFWVVPEDGSDAIAALPARYGVFLARRSKPASGGTVQGRLPEVRDAMNGGRYLAAHFVDDTCDGCVEAVVAGLPLPLESLPAFSLVTAPDFFPLADQVELQAAAAMGNVRPLSNGRLPVNPSLRRPSRPAEPAFVRHDRTVTAIVGARATGPQVPIVGVRNRAVSCLPDGASDVFAPGWDTSRSRDALGPFLTTSGLGSPFPEDAKLCAALASFWPAVAPDNGRTFGNVRNFGNQLPMLDEELGFHPRHPRVRAGEVASFRGWDGEFGPFYEEIGGELHVNHVVMERSDYVTHALQGQIKVSLTAQVQSEDLIARNRALAACHAIAQVPRADVCLVVVGQVADWAAAGRGHADLAGGGFLLEFAELTGSTKATAELDRVVRAVRKRHVCQVGSNGIAYRNGEAPFVFRRF